MRSSCFSFAPAVSMPRQVSVVGESVTTHEDGWDAAVGHVAEVTGIEREQLWFRPGEIGMLVFDGWKATVQTPVGCILSAVEFQRAKSRGDLEDLLTLPVHVALGTRQQIQPASPEVNAPDWLHTTTADAMKLPPPQKSTKPNREEHEKWTGEEEYSSWLANDDLFDVLGVRLGDVLRCYATRKKWRVDSWGFQHDDRQTTVRLLLRDAKVTKPEDGTLGADADWAEHCVRGKKKANCIVADHGKGAVFEIVPTKPGEPATQETPSKSGKAKQIKVQAEQFALLPEDSDSFSPQPYQPPMKTAKPSKAKSEAKPEIYVVVKDLMWKGNLHKPGAHIQFAERGSHSNRDRWLAAKRIRPLTDKEWKLEQLRWKEMPAKEAMSDREKDALPIADRFEQIERRLIDRSPWNPRKDFTSDGAKEYLAGIAQSIREMGIVEPIIVRPSDLEGRFEIVAGECRWRAADLASLDVLPCIVRDLDKHAAIKVQAVENLQRRDLNPMEEAEGYRLLMEEGGCTVPDICRETGKSEASVYDRLKLLECPPGVRQAVEDKRLPATTAGLIARLPKEKQFAAMDAILFAPPGAGEEEGNVLSFRQAKEWVRTATEESRTVIEWQKVAKAHPLAAVSTVFDVEKSNGLLFPGGWLKNSKGDGFVRPGDVCSKDPERRTWEKLFEATGTVPPPPFLAREPQGGKAVVLIREADALAQLGDTIPDPAEYERRQKAVQEQAAKEREAAAARRREAEAAHEAQIVAVVEECEGLDWTGDVEHRFLRRILVTTIREEIASGLGRFDEAVKRRGLAKEGKAAYYWTDREVCNLANSCTTSQLRGWLLEMTFRDQQEDPEAWFDEPTPLDGDMEETANVCGSSTIAEASQEEVV